jgi:hypothetical protein
MVSGGSFIVSIVLLSGKMHSALCCVCLILSSEAATRHTAAAAEKLFLPCPAPMVIFYGKGNKRASATGDGLVA